MFKFIQLPVLARLIFYFILLITFAPNSQAHVGCMDYLGGTLSAPQHPLELSSESVLKRRLFVEVIVDDSTVLSERLSRDQIITKLDAPLNGQRQVEFSKNINQMILDVPAIYLEAYLARLYSTQLYMMEFLKRQNRSAPGEMLDEMPPIEEPFTGKQVSLTAIALEQWISDLSSLSDAELVVNGHLAASYVESKILKSHANSQSFVMLGLRLRYDLIQPILENRASLSDWSKAFSFAEVDESSKYHLLWIYQSFIREKQIQELMIGEGATGKFQWAKDKFRYGKYMMLMAAYPELLYFYDRIDQLGFEPFVNFEDYYGVNTAYVPSKLNEDYGLFFNLFYEEKGQNKVAIPHIHLQFPESYDLMDRDSYDDQIDQMMSWLSLQWTRFKNEREVEGVGLTFLFNEDSMRAEAHIDVLTSKPDLPLSGVDVMGEFFLYLKQ